MKLVIFAVVVAGLAAVVGAIVVGNSSFDGTVVDNAYEAGLKWDNIRKAREESGLRPEIMNRPLRTGGNTLRIGISGPDGKPYNAEFIRARLTRPFASREDRRLMMKKTGEGIFENDVVFSDYGLWNISITVPFGEKEVVFDEQLYVEKK